ARSPLAAAPLLTPGVALGRPAAAFPRHVDSLTFCLSKGLAAPVGSLVCGSREFVARARRVRKMVGGGMRQVGILAAAGLIALDTMVERLAEDHEHVKRLAPGLAALPRPRLAPEKVQTNIVIFHVDRDGGSAELAAGCLARKVKIHQIGPGAIRCVTHKDVDGEDIDRALDAFREITATWEQEPTRWPSACWTSRISRRTSSRTKAWCAPWMAWTCTSRRARRWAWWASPAAASR